MPQQAASEMGVGLPQPACRSRLQTTVQVSKVLDGVKTGDLTFSQDESGGYLLTGQAAPGIEVA